MSNGINQLIASPRTPDILGQFSRGLSTGQALQSQNLANQQAQQQMAQQQKINQLLQGQAQQFAQPMAQPQAGGQPAAGIPPAQGAQPQSKQYGWQKYLTDTDRQQAQLLAAQGDVEGMMKLKKEVESRGRPDETFLKEERQNATQAMNALNKKAGELRASYGKVKGLKDQAMAGSRQARAGMIINVARLLSPGIVTDADFQALTGGANPLQSALTFISNKNADVGNMLSSYVDPLGESFNGEALFQIANSAFEPEAKGIFDRLNDVKSRATSAELNERQMETMFAGTSNIEALRKLTNEGSVYEYKTVTGETIQKPLGDITTDDLDNMDINDLQELLATHPDIQ